MEHYIGQIILVPKVEGRNLKGFLQCDGKVYTVGDYPALASILKHYGHMGDDNSRFSLPTLVGPEGFDYVICYDGLYPEYL